jgi:hypothetical protein
MSSAPGWLMLTCTQKFHHCLQPLLSPSVVTLMERMRQCQVFQHLQSEARPVQRPDVGHLDDVALPKAPPLSPSSMHF